MLLDITSFPRLLRHAHGLYRFRFGSDARQARVLASLQFVSPVPVEPAGAAHVYQVPIRWFGGCMPSVVQRARTLHSQRLAVCCQQLVCCCGAHSYSLRRVPLVPSNPPEMIRRRGTWHPGLRRIEARLCTRMSSEKFSLLELLELLAHRFGSAVNLACDSLTRFFYNSSRN